MSLHELKSHPTLSKIWHSKVSHVCNYRMPKCVKSLYRTADGSCNNLAHPTWGMSHRDQKRYLPSAYEDGKNYCAYTILWKPPFCISPCSKRPTYKYDIVILLHFKNRKNCHKNFENRFINKKITPQNDLDLIFYMCKGSNPKS